jgi:TolB-like protein
MTIWSTEIKDLEKLFDSFKGRHPKLDRELEKLIKTDDENMVLIYARRCLEVIITDLCELELKRPRGTEPLKGIIDKLNREEKVPENIITSMQSLNSMSTFGAHPKDFEPEQVKPVLNNLDIIIKWYLNYKGFRFPFKEKQEVQADVFDLSKRKESPFQKQSPRRILIPAFMGIILILALIYFIPKLVQKAGKQKSVATEMVRSIAVMPVLNFTGDPGMAWIADMIQNDLTGQLQGISNLIVRPRQTTLQFRDSEASLQSIAQKLSVNSLIEASIKGTEDNLQLEIRVLEAFPEEKYLYSSSFIQSFNKLTNIYGEIINDILKRLKVNTTDEEEKVLSARTVNPAVRKACARGLYFMNQLTEEGVEMGIKYYKEAIDIDPADPEPYIGLALGYSGAGHGAGLASLDLAKAYALKAIELDPDELHPNLADAHVVLAEVYLYHDYNFAKSEYHLKHAIAVLLPITHMDGILPLPTRLMKQLMR